MPAILIGGFALVLAFGSNAISGDQIRPNYKIRAQRAFAEGRFEEARVRFERLGPSSAPEVQLGLALSVHHLGQTERAIAILDQLAPLDTRGYAPAHVWQAAQILKAARPTVKDLGKAELHLRRALQAQPESTEVHALLGQLFLRTNRPDRATEHLARAVERYPEFGLILAQLYKAAGAKEKATRWAKESASRDQQLVKKAPDDRLARLRWAEATRLLGGYEEAETILKEGLLLHPGQDYRSALGQVYAIWADSILSERPPRMEQGLVLLERALDCDPGNAVALARLIELTHLPENAAEQAKKRLQGLLADGTATATLHLCLGIDAWQRGQRKPAEQHLARAFAMAPHLPQVANNLAWTLAHQESPDLARALEIINALLSRHPGNPHFRDTRGHILALLNRWEEAVNDLEVALPHLQARQKTHQALAKAYFHLGLPELGMEHERRAAQPAR